MKIRLLENRQELSFNKLKYTFLIILKVYILIFVLYSTLGLIDHFITSIDFSIVKSINKTDGFVEKYSVLLLGIKTLLIAPLIEELIFREPIKKSRISNAILLLVFSYSIVMLIIKPNLNFYFLGTYSCILLLFNNLYKNKKQAFFLSLIFTSFVFGSFHINNVEYVRHNEWYLYIYKIFPLIVLGFGLGAIRLKLNTFWSIVGHSIFNLIPFIFKYII